MGLRDKDEKSAIIGRNARERFLERRSGVIVQPLMAPLQETSIRARSRLCLSLFASNTAVRKVRYARTRPTVKILSCPCQLKMRLRTKTKLRSKTFKYKTRRKMFRFLCAGDVKNYRMEQKLVRYRWLNGIAAVKRIVTSTPNARMYVHIRCSSKFFNFNSKRRSNIFSNISKISIPIIFSHFKLLRKRRLYKLL